MKILHIMAGKGLGGAETYSADMMLSLHKSGVDQCVVIHRKAPRYAELEAAGIRLAPWVLDIPVHFVRQFLLWILLRRERPDIVHCWMRRAASLVPFYAEMMHEGPKPVILGWFGGYYDVDHFRRCGPFVGVTKDIVAHMMRSGVPAARAHFIPTFPEIPEMPPVDRAVLGTPKDAKVLLALSRLHPKKGIDTLLHALKELPDCYAWLAGEGPDRRKLGALAKELGLGTRARFLGWRTDRTALLRSADACVLPSRYEPFGTVILEAWAAGVPLVACAAAGPAAHVENNKTGLLVPIDDPPALAAAIRRALDDQALRQKLITEGKSAYARTYTREAVTREWIAYYRRLAEGRGV
jgi:glycosyltransferase involved in cell wall biosynthesis